MILIANYLVPDIVGSGVGGGEDGCAPAGSRSSGCGAENILHLTAFSRTCLHKRLYLSVISQILCCGSFGNGCCLFIILYCPPHRYAACAHSPALHSFRLGEGSICGNTTEPIFCCARCGNIRSKAYHFVQSLAIEEHIVVTLDS